MALIFRRGRQGISIHSGVTELDELAQASFGHLLPMNVEVSSGEFADIIAETYSLANEKVLSVFNHLKRDATMRQPRTFGGLPVGAKFYESEFSRMKWSKIQPFGCNSTETYANASTHGNIKSFFTPQMIVYIPPSHE